MKTRDLVELFGLMVLTALVPYVVIQYMGLEDEAATLRGKLEGTQEVPPEIRVTCECPAYEEGFDDCEFVQGCDNFEMPYEDFRTMCSGFNDCDDLQACDPAEIPHEDLKVICAEFDMYGYVPGC